MTSALARTTLRSSNVYLRGLTESCGKLVPRRLAFSFRHIVDGKTVVPHALIGFFLVLFHLFTMSILLQADQVRGRC